MTEQRDDPMRLWIGKWRPEPAVRPVPVEKNDEKKPSVENDRVAIAG